MSYTNITGIGRVPVNRVENITLAQYDGEAKPGELVVDLTTNNLYVAANTGNLQIVGGGGNGGSPAGSSKDIQFNTAGAFAANSTFQFDDTTGILSVNAIAANTITMTGDILPASDNAYSLGSNAMQWKELWVSGNTIYLDGTALSVQSNTSIAFGGNTLLTTDETGGMNVTTVSVAGNVDAGNINAGTGVFTQPFDEEMEVEGIVVGHNDTPRILFSNGNNAQNWQIDNDAGTMRFFLPGNTIATLNTDGTFTTSQAALSNLSVTGNTHSGNTFVGGAGGSTPVADYTATGTEITFGFGDIMYSPEPFTAGDVCQVTGTGEAGLDGIYTVTAGYSYGFTVASNHAAGSAMFSNPLPAASPYFSRDLSATGNVAASYFIGNGALLTGISGGGGSDYGNANLANIGSNSIGTTGNVSATFVVASDIYSNVDVIIGDRANTSASKLRLVATVGNTFIQSGNGTVGTTGNIVFATYASTNARAVINTTDGSISAVGDISTSGKINVLASGGNEGGEMFLAAPASNTVLANGINIDVWQNRLRFFEAGGNARGAYIDISAMADSVGTNLAGGGSSTLNVVSANTATVTLTSADSGKYYVLGSAVNTFNLPTGAAAGTYFELASSKGSSIYFFPPGSDTIQFTVAGSGPSNLDQFMINGYGYARLVKTTTTNWVLTGENLSVAA